MKNLLLILLFCLFNTQLNWAQIQSGEIRYKISVTDDFSEYQDTTGLSEHMKRFWLQYYTDLKKSVHTINHQVVFNRNEGLSTTEKLMDSDQGFSVRRTQMATYTDNVYYFNFKERSSTQQFKNFNQTLRVIRYPDSLDWELHDEFKEIQGYTCQKATVDYTFNHLVKNDITVWFTPELPFFVGPIGIAGVPGAILGFEKSGLFFFADKIKLSKKELKITPAEKGRLLTSKAYQEMIMDKDPRAKDYMEKRRKEGK